VRATLRVFEAPSCGKWNEQQMYEGTLIRDLFALVEGAERDVPTQPTDAESVAQLDKRIEEVSASVPSQSEKLAEPFGLSAADRDLGLLLVVHAQLVGALEPGNHLADAVDVHDIGTVSAPEEFGV
jgi:hypothetical protein